MALPFPLSVLEMPFQAYDAVRDRMARGRYRDQVLGGVEALQAEDFRNAGIDPRAVMPLTPAQREETFAQINQAQPQGYPGVQEQVAGARAAAPPTRDRLRSLFSPEVLMSPDFDAIVEQIAGKDYTLSQGQRRMQGGNVIAENPAALTQVAPGGALADASGTVVLERPGYRTVSEGGTLVQTTDDGTQVEMRVPKTYAPGSGGGGGGAVGAPGAPGKAPTMKKFGENWYEWNGEQWVTPQYTEAEDPRDRKIDFGDYVVERKYSRASDMKNSSVVIDRLQDVNAATKLLTTLDAVANANPQLTGVRGVVTGALSTGRDLIADFVSQDQADAAVAEVTNVLQTASADPDPEIATQAREFLADPSAIGSMNALTFASGYVVPRGLRDSGRLAASELDATRKALDPRGRWSSQQARAQIRAQADLMRRREDELIQRANAEPNMSVYRKGEQAPTAQTTGPSLGNTAPAAAPRRFKMDANGNLVGGP